MLVHFERDGEVLYDVWPEKIITGISSLTPDPSPVREGSTFDLQGRRLNTLPLKGAGGSLKGAGGSGIYIVNGRKKVIK